MEKEKGRKRWRWQIRPVDWENDPLEGYVPYYDVVSGVWFSTKPLAFWTAHGRPSAYPHVRGAQRTRQDAVPCSSTSVSNFRRIWGNSSNSKINCLTKVKSFWRNRGVNIFLNIFPRILPQPVGNTVFETNFEWKNIF